MSWEFREAGKYRRWTSLKEVWPSPGPATWLIDKREMNVLKSFLLKLCLEAGFSVDNRLRAVCTRAWGK
jgi:hypothetical protein